MAAAAAAKTRNKALQQSIAEAADASPSHDAHVMDAQVSTPTYSTKRQADDTHTSHHLHAHGTGM